MTTTWNKRYRILGISAVLIVMWIALAVVISGMYFQSEMQEQVTADVVHCNQGADDLADSIRRNLAYVHGIPQVLSQLLRVKAALGRFGADAIPSNQPIEELTKRWTFDPALNDLDRYLALAQTSLNVNLIYVINAAGDCIAASNWDKPGTPVGSNFAERAYFKSNAAGQPGFQYAMGKTTHIPGLYFSYPVIIDGKFMGAVVAKMDVPQLSFLTRQLNAFVADENGVVILAHDKHMENTVLQDAKLHKLSREAILQRYRREDFPELLIEPWDDSRFPEFKRVQAASTPYVAAQRQLDEYGMQVHVMEPVDEYQPLLRESNWLALLLAILGSVLILFGVSSVSYFMSIKKSRSELNVQNGRLTAFMQAASDGIHIVDTAGLLVEANEAFCRLLGYTRQELAGMQVSQWADEMTPEQVIQVIAQVLARGGDTGEAVFVRKDGQRIDVEISRVPFEIEGRKFIHAAARDITERKREQRALEIMKFAIDHLGDKVIWTTADARVVYANEAACRSLGYSAEEMLTKSIPDFDPDFQMDVWPEHWEELKQARSFTFESRHRNKEGKTHPVEVSVNYLRYGDEEFNCAYVRDITERKRIEEELRLAELALQNSSEAMVVTDDLNNIIAVNPAFTTISGYTLDEVRGKNPRVLASGRHDRDFFQQMWNALNTCGHWQGEIWDKRKNGGTLVKWMTINTIPNPDGSVHRYVALFSDVTAKKQAEELIWRQANIDELTGLPNRRMLQNRIEQEMAKARHDGSVLSLLLVDLDEFKEVNDTLGHAIGDLLLKKAAQRIGKNMRDGDILARLGGDEFMVVLTGLAGNAHVEDIAEKIIRHLAEPFNLADQTVYVTASIGITLFPDDATDIGVLLRNADQAMYVAKKLGRNQFSYFTHALQEEAQKRLHLISDLRHALDGDQFQLHFQPIVELATGRIHKTEALLRWRHPQQGFISPMEFIPLAEQTGLINPIGDWVFRVSVNWAQRWVSQYGQDFQIAVNKSPVQFKMEGNKYSDAWAGYLQCANLTGSHIVIEITEGLLLNAELDVTTKLLGFRDNGIQVAIDDFGTGYSSLAYLKKFDIDYLKIDRAFVRNLETDGDDRALCEAIIVMAHKLGLKVIAEGVETAGQRNLLAAAGCDYAQGNLFSKPLPPEQFEELMNLHGSGMKPECAIDY